MYILAGTTFAAGATYMTSEKVIVSTPDASLGIEQVKVGGVCVTYSDARKDLQKINQPIHL